MTEAVEFDPDWVVHPRHTILEILNAIKANPVEWLCETAARKLTTNPEHQRDRYTAEVASWLDGKGELSLLCQHAVADTLSISDRFLHNLITNHREGLAQGKKDVDP